MIESCLTTMIRTLALHRHPPICRIRTNEEWSPADAGDHSRVPEGTPVSEIRTRDSLPRPKLPGVLTHERAGWSLIDMWFFEQGSNAHAVEQAVLDTWADFDFAVDPEDMPQAGHTETVSLDDATEDKVAAFIESTTRFLDDHSAG
jgi:hypothetical protein